MKTSLFSIFAASALMIGMQANAQTTTPSNTGNLAGEADATPGDLHVNLDKIGDAIDQIKIDLKKLPDFSKWVLQRLHTVSMDERIANMVQNGKTSQKFVAAFSAEGALAYQFELDGDSLKNWDDIGRNAGLEIIPYEIQLNADGTSKVSISTFAWKNMNALQNTSHAVAIGDRDNTKFFRFVDYIDAFSFTWDQKSEFNNLKVFRVDLVKFGLKGGLYKDKKGNYLALRTGASTGVSQFQFDNSSLPYGVRDHSSVRFLQDARFYAGIEYNHQKANGLKINVQSNYSGGAHWVDFTDQDAVDHNLETKQNYQAASAQYSSNLASWNQQKDIYETSLGHTVTDADFATYSGVSKPTAPSRPGKDLSTDANMIRSYGYIKNSIDISKPIGKGHPKRIGVAAEYNIALFDHVEGHYGTKIDMKGHYKQVFTGKVYLNF